MIERLVDAAAREIGIAPDALRRRNFIKPGDAVHDRDRQDLRFRRLRRAISRARRSCADWNGFRTARRRNRESSGGCAASALATYIEACGAIGPDTATRAPR